MKLMRFLFGFVTYLYLYEIFCSSVLKSLYGPIGISVANSTNKHPIIYIEKQN